MPLPPVKVIAEVNQRELRVVPRAVQMSLVATPELRVSLGSRGLTGQTGPSGVALAPIAFAFGDASPRLILTLDGDAIITSVIVKVDIAFDGDAPTLEVGTNAVPDLLVSIDDASIAIVGEFETSPCARLDVGTEIFIRVTPGFGAATGAGYLIFNLAKF